MSSLLAFEAAARHSSFTRAATELNLTQGAVSQRIKALEDLLGHQLFVREGNAVRITDEGRHYLASARMALAEVQSATSRAVERHRGDILTIACLGTFALKCLIPRLKEFRRQRPNIALRLRTLHPLEEASRQDHDVSIQYGVRSRWPDMVLAKLGDDFLFPVCSPDLLQEGEGLTSPRDLVRHTIIRTLSPIDIQGDWSLWLDRAGLPELMSASELHCDTLFSSYEAAIEGLGVTMGRWSVARMDLAAGRLVEPFTIRLPSPLGYHVIATPERAKLAKVAAFFEWAAEHLHNTAQPHPH
jgi:LysR family glycine cleavage system transcriptional activator